MELRYLPLLLVVLLAMAVPLLLSRFKRIPVVVGEILAGILIGPSLLGLVHGDEPTLELLSEIGFAFLMFLSGLEIDFSILFASSRTAQKRQNVNPLWLALLSFLLTLVLAAMIGLGMQAQGLITDSWMMMLILSTTSLGIVVPVLKERSLSGTRLGQTILLAALLADFLTMFMITVYVGVRSSGLTLDILLIGALFIPVVFLYQLGTRHLRRDAVRRLLRELSDATSQIKVRGAFALMIAFVVLAELLNAELILGAFLGGALASLLSGPDEENLRHKLDAIGFGFFIPLFFVYVGIRFDLQAFLADSSAWILVPELLLAAFAIKMISTLPFKKVFTWRQTFASGLLLSSRLSLIIAASAIGLRLNLISEATNAGIILIAALTATFAPLLFNTILPGVEAREPRRMLIFGTSDLAFQVASEMRAHGEEVTFIEPNIHAVERLQDAGFDSVCTADNIDACLDDLPGGRVEAFLALSDNDNANLDACRAVSARGYQHLLAFTSDPRRMPEYRSLGVQVMSPSLHRSALMALMARNPAMFTLLTSTKDRHDLREFTLTNTDVVGKRLSELRLPGELLVLAIGRDDEVIVPHGSTRLVAGDRLTLLGSLEDLTELQGWLNGMGD